MLLLDTESQDHKDHPYHVYTNRQERDEDLNAAFNAPCRLRHIDCFVLGYPSLAVHGLPTGPADALHIGYELDRIPCYYLIGSAMVFSAVAGITISVLTSRVEIGLAASAAISAWVACVEAVLLWIYS